MVASLLAQLSRLTTQQERNGVEHSHLGTGWSTEWARSGHVLAAPLVTAELQAVGKQVAVELDHGLEARATSLEAVLKQLVHQVKHTHLDWRSSLRVWVMDMVMVSSGLWLGLGLRLGLWFGLGLGLDGTKPARQ